MKPAQQRHSTNMNKLLVIVIFLGFSCQSNRKLKKDLDCSPVKYWEIVNSTCYLIYADSIEENKERSLKFLEQKLNFERSFISKELKRQNRMKADHS